MNISEERRVFQALKDLESLLSLVDTLTKRLEALESRLKAVEERRGPGRPRKEHGN